MELCPKFWSWLDEANRSGSVFSIHRVKEELVCYGDELSDWAKQKDDHFFLKFDEPAMEKLADVAQLVNNNPYFTEANRADFYTKADCYLIAHALAYGFTVVTFEKGVAANSSKIKIPSICQGLNVSCINLWALLKSQKVSLS
jgi:uncharacterized protein DUF4411